MKWPDIPTAEDKPPWGAMFGAASMAYMFVGPWQRAAAWPEWLWTTLAFLAFLALYTLGVIFWSRKNIVLRVCVGLAILGVAFTTYRPSGIVLFVYVAALGPFAMGGRIGGSAAIVATAAALIVGQWALFWPPSYFPYTFAVVAVVLGAALTVVARQRAAMAQIHKSAERERIARDLHDILGHTLSVIVLKSELAGRLLEQDPRRARSEIEDVERISRQALAEVREAIAGYRSGNLRTELDRTRATLQSAGIEVECDIEEVGMPIAHERVLALVLREAITNVIRHANARRCRVSVRRNNGACRMEVRDDGRGGIGSEGMGMRGIRERISALGGEVSWAGGAGTAMIVTLPLVTSV
jgi:two-component system sensor histidine kinase DesK